MSVLMRAPGLTKMTIDNKTRGATRRGLSDKKRYSRRGEIFPMTGVTPDDKRYSQ